MPADAFCPCGDAEIDATRRKIPAAPTGRESYPRRLDLLSAWVYLLHRCGVDLADAVGALDALQDAADRGDAPGAFAALDAAYARLETRQPDETQIVANLDESDLAAEGPADEPEPAPRNWPVYGGDARHTASTRAPGPWRGRTAWRFPSGVAWYARPRVEGDRVYVASPGMRITAWRLDLATGDPTGGYFPRMIFSPSKRTVCLPTVTTASSPLPLTLTSGCSPLPTVATKK